MLFMSGYTDDAVCGDGVLEAGSAFLQKPFSPVLPRPQGPRGPRRLSPAVPSANGLAQRSGPPDPRRLSPATSPSAPRAPGPRHRSFTRPRGTRARRIGERKLASEGPHHRPRRAAAQPEGLRPRDSAPRASPSSPGRAARESRRSPSTPSTPRGSAATSSRSRRTRRQFLERMEKPDVDSVEGLSPAVAIEQKNPTKTSRSTVGTATEIYDYLRLLWARVGRTYCPLCGREMRPDTVQSVTDAVLGAAGRGRGSRRVPARASRASVTHERRGREPARAGLPPRPGRRRDAAPRRAGRGSADGSATTSPTPTRCWSSSTGSSCGRTIARASRRRGRHGVPRRRRRLRHPVRRAGRATRDARPRRCCASPSGSSARTTETRVPRRPRRSSSRSTIRAARARRCNGSARRSSTTRR